MQQIWKFSHIIILNISSIFSKIISSFCYRAILYLIVFLSIHTFSLAITDVEQLQKLVAPDRAANDTFGWSVSINGDYAIVGARQNDKDENGGNTLANAGSAYIYVRNGTSWTLQQKIVASDRGAGDKFGIAVSISGDYILIGSPDEDEDASGGNTLADAGSAYIFVRSGTTWTEQQKLVASDRAANDSFGYNISMTGDYAVIGAYLEDEDTSGGNTLADAGSVYVFVRNGVTWTEQQKLVASDRTAGDQFGLSLSINNNYIIVGSRFNDEDESGGNILADAGSAYIFVRNGSTWSQQQKLVASDRTAGDQFGCWVSISGSHVIIGAFAEDEDANGGNTLANAGSAYFFVRSGSNWTEQQKLVNSDRGAADNFGVRVSIHNNYVIIGAHSEDEDVNGGNTLTSAGSAYIFQIIESNNTYAIELDGNQDGILDSTQDHVHTFYDPTGTKLITIVDLNNNILSEVRSIYSSDNTYNYLFGLINFKVQATETQMKIIFHGVSNLTGYEYRKLFPDNIYRQFDNAVFSTEIIGGNQVATVTLTLVDGGAGDYDGIVNGIIYDPGGPAIAIGSQIPTLSEWARIFAFCIFIGVSIWWWRRV